MMSMPVIVVHDTFRDGSLKNATCAGCAQGHGNQPSKTQRGRRGEGEI